MIEDRHPICALMLHIAMLAIFAGLVMWKPALSAEPMRPVPKAVCGPEDHQESVQGETTLAERFAPGRAQSYNCNLVLVGQYEGEGAGFMMTGTDDCAYFSTGYSHSYSQRMRHPGVNVLDVSDATHPTLTEYLTSPAMFSANESIRVENKRHLLIANDVNTTVFDIYDISTDCRHPKLKSSTSLPKVQSHSGEFSPTGKTLYAASDAEYSCANCDKQSLDPSAPPPSAVFAIDVTDPSHPRPLGTWIPPDPEWKTHSVSVNREGTRAYVSLWRNIGGPQYARNPNGLVILDIGDFEARRSNAQFHVISSLFWNDTSLSQFSIPVTIQHHAYLIWTDLVGTIIASNGFDDYPSVSACASQKPTFGFARIIDVQDEVHPKSESGLMLEVDAPENCSKVIHDPIEWFGYGSEGCDVDNSENARLLACGYWEGGLRVFDIRDPAHPKEIAYYKPPARHKEIRRGSPVDNSGADRPAFPSDHTADAVIAPRFRKRGKEIWFTSLDNGFQVVRFSDRFVAAHEELFVPN